MDMVDHTDHWTGSRVTPSPTFELGQNFFLKPADRCEFVSLVDDPHRKEYRIRFTPPLTRNESLDYWVEYVWPSMFCVTREQTQEVMGVPFESATYTIRHDTDVLDVMVKFKGKLGDKIRNPSIHVLDLAGDSKPGEAEAIKRRDPKALTVGRDVDGKRILTLRIRRPKIAYRYGIKWEMPESH